MKKRLIALILVLTCALAGVAVAAGGSQDPLISLSYLNGTYWSELTVKVASAVANATKPLYNQAVAKLNGLTGADDTGAAWLSSDVLKTQGGERGDTITLALGSSLLWTSGTATVNGPLVDVTTGQELTPGAALTSGHRYLAPEELVVTVTSKTAYWAVQGKWTTTSDGVSVTELPFTDVPDGAYYYDAIAWAVEKGITYGSSSTTFGVGETCNRADAMTFIWRAYGCPEPKTGKNPFTDVSENAYYCKAVLWAVEKGITVGTSSTTFSPLEPCRREHVITFLYRAAGSPAMSQSSGFSDVADSAYYASAVTWAVRNQITVGNGNGNATFGPTSSCTRQDIVTFLYRGLAE